MTSSEREIIVLYDEVCLGNSDALRFIFHWNMFIHGIDDLIDDPVRPKPEDVIAVFAQANILYTQPFYQAHAVKLQMVVMLVTNAYADSVLWENEKRIGLGAMADVLRFAGNEMMFAVALIVGGYQHMRKISVKLRENSWESHHDETGKPK